LRVQGVGLRVEGSGFGVEGLGFRVLCRVRGLGFRVGRRPLVGHEVIDLLDRAVQILARYLAPARQPKSYVILP